MSVYGLWSLGTEYILKFVRVTDPSAKSYRKKDPIKVRNSGEAKEGKYLRRKRLEVLLGRPYLRLTEDLAPPLKTGYDSSKYLDPKGVYDRYYLEVQSRHDLSTLFFGHCLFEADSASAVMEWM